MFTNLTSAHIHIFLFLDHERNWLWTAKLPLQPYPHQKSQQVLQIVNIEIYNTYKVARPDQTKPDQTRPSLSGLANCNLCPQLAKYFQSISIEFIKLWQKL